MSQIFRQLSTLLLIFLFRLSTFLTWYSLKKTSLFSAVSHSQAATVGTEVLFLFLNSSVFRVYTQRLHLNHSHRRKDFRMYSATSGIPQTAGTVRTFQIHPTVYPMVFSMHSLLSPQHSLLKLFRDFHSTFTPTHFSRHLNSSSLLSQHFLKMSRVLSALML